MQSNVGDVGGEGGGDGVDASNIERHDDDDAHDNSAGETKNDRIGMVASTVKPVMALAPVHSMGQLEDVNEIFNLTKYPWTGGRYRGDGNAVKRGGCWRRLVVIL